MKNAKLVELFCRRSHFSNEDFLISFLESHERVEILLGRPPLVGHMSTHERRLQNNFFPSFTCQLSITRRPLVERRKKLMCVGQFFSWDPFR